MIRWFVALALAACSAFSALAQTPAAPAVVGKKCALCHGAKGESAGEDFPRLAAQNETYLAKQLRDFKAGRREGFMARMVRDLSEDDIVAVARFYAAQPAPPSSGTKSELSDVGRFVHLRGNPASTVPACKSCHGEDAHGTETLPRLAGQNAAYLERQIREFTQRKRTNDNEIMHVIAERLTELELKAVASYLATLP